jgi:pSer/pThr/pTyr-binding forkhead associated (FHA) protein
VAREGQQFCYRCGQDLRSFYSAQGINIKGTEPESAPPAGSPDLPVSEQPAPEGESSTPLAELNPLEITSDSVRPSEVAEQKATLRILLPTGDLFDRELTRIETQLGKNPRNDLVIADSSVSTTHAVIRNDNGVYSVSDLGSRNGTYVNGERITEPRKLQHGDVIGLGLTKLTFRLANHSETGAIDVTVMLPGVPGVTAPPPLTEDSLARAAVAERLVSEADVQRLRGPDARDRRLYRALVEESAVGEESLRNLMSRVFQLKALDLATTPVDESLTARFPSQLARQHRVFPIAVEADKLILAVSDPTDTAAVDAAKRKTARSVDMRLATSTEIDNLINRYYGPKLIGVLPSGEKLEYPVVQPEIEIGKAPHNHIVLADPTVSNTHAIILAREGGYNIVDLGSRNGTFINGERLSDRSHVLRHGDAIQLGQTVLTFRNEQETKENITATLSAEALEAVRKRAAMSSPPDVNTPPVPMEAHGSGAPRPMKHKPSDELTPGLGEPASVALTDAETEAEKKKKKKKKKGDRERIKAAYIRAIGTILGPILSVAATVALTIYLMRPSAGPEKPVVDISPKGNAKPKLGLTSAATPITGGTYEASGVVQVPGTDNVLFVDDNSPGKVYLMQLDQSGRQTGQIKPIALGVTVEDPEGITFDGNYFYVVGSQSNPKAGDQNALVRFLFDPANGALQGSPQVLTDLRRFLIDNVAELKDLADVKGDDGGINIEGIGWDPDHARLRLGLRSPVPGGLALVVSIKLRDPMGSFSVDNLQLAEPGAITKLSLGGLGIRDIQYDRRLKSFLIIAGAATHGEKVDFFLWEWNGDSDQSKPESQPRKEAAVLERNTKPEGVTNVRTSSGSSFIFITGDASNYLKLDYAEGQ